MTEPATHITGYPTGMRASHGQDWQVPADRLYDPDGNPAGHLLQATLRQVGWLDQKGRVWLRVPPSTGFDGGSLTPLLIDVRENPGGLFSGPPVVPAEQP